MITVYSPHHQLHCGSHELHRGRLYPCFEDPQRAEIILDAIRNSQLGEVRQAHDHGLAPLLRVHDAAYVEFLQTVFDEWKEHYPELSQILPHIWPGRRMSGRVPESLLGRLGHYSFDAGTPIVAGTWQAACWAANTALTAQQLLRDGHRSAFALVRPPGHHAARDYYGGYCFLNNAAIAATACLQGGAQRVAILDVDYHHANGTQDIFYDRDDVLVVSLHGDPAFEYPYFLGYAEEQGEGVGLGYNINCPLPAGTTWDQYHRCLNEVSAQIVDAAVDYLVVSLGVDTWQGDPLSQFRIHSDDFCVMGETIAQLGLPTLFVLEGGYAVQDLGRNLLNVLQPFQATHV